jgi:hypothetical protein
MQGFANAGDCAMMMSPVLPENTFESIEKARIPASQPWITGRDGSYEEDLLLTTILM